MSATQLKTDAWQDVLALLPTTARKVASALGCTITEAERGIDQLCVAGVVVRRRFPDGHIYACPPDHTEAEQHDKFWQTDDARPTLHELRWARDVIAWASKAGGPRRPRGALGDAGAVIEACSNDEVERAREMLARAANVGSPLARRILAHAVAGNSVHEFARMWKLSPQFVGAYLDAALDEVEQSENFRYLVP